MRSLKLRLLLAYNGSGFRGFALNPGVHTVAGVLTVALERYLSQEISLVCAGRTDAGVHAWGQVVSFEVDTTSEVSLLDLQKLRDSINKMCGPEVAVREVAWVTDDFDARRSATERTYRYNICNHPVANPLTAHMTWHIAAPLNIDAMNQAAQHILGEHDFASFCRRAENKSMVRRVNRAVWWRSATNNSSSATSPDSHEIAQEMTVLEIAASSFCHQMVRSLVGTFVEIGLGKRSPEAMAEILAAHNRQAAANLAPPKGLCLWEVAFA